MPGVRRLRRLRQLRFLLLFPLVAACEEDTLEIPWAPNWHCGDLFKVESGDAFLLREPIVLPVGGSRRLRVRLVSVTEELYSHCPEVSLDGFRWTIHDPNLARVEAGGAGIATITGLAAGTTGIEVRFQSSGVDTNVWRELSLEVVESAGSKAREFER